MASTAKANSIARQLKEDLALRLSSLAIADGYDASGNPQVTLGTLLAASESAYIRVIPESTIQVDGLGLTQRVYTPHIIQIVLEMFTTTNLTYMTAPKLMLLLGECLKHGTKVELYLSDNTDVVAVGEIIADNLVQTWSHLWQPLTNQI